MDFKKYIILLLSEGELKVQKAMLMILICYESVERCLISVCLYTEYPVSFANFSANDLYSVPLFLAVIKMVYEYQSHLCTHSRSA